MKFLYKNDGKLTTEIEVDYTKNKVRIVNHSDFPLDLAFGINKNPTIEDFEEFLESRCFPRERDMMKLHLKELDLDYYDPLSIVMKTKGILEGDNYSLERIE